MLRKLALLLGFVGMLALASISLPINPASAQMLGPSCGGSMGEGCMSPQGAFNQARRFHLPQWGVRGRQGPPPGNVYRGVPVGGYGPPVAYGGPVPVAPARRCCAVPVAAAPVAVARVAAAPALPALPPGQHYENINGRVIIVQR